MSESKESGNSRWRQKWCVYVVSLGHTPLTRVVFFMTTITTLSIPNSCGHDTGELRSRSSRSDNHSTAHSHVLSRVVSRLIRISVFPCFRGVLTSSLNNKSASERDNHVLEMILLQPNTKSRETGEKCHATTLIHRKPVKLSK
jgi:hypothetical protein